MSPPRSEAAAAIAAAIAVTIAAVATAIITRRHCRCHRHCSRLTKVSKFIITSFSIPVNLRVAVGNRWAAWAVMWELDGRMNT
jgi:putative flippase GtrA